MNLLDRALLEIAPKLAAERLRNRRLAHIQMRYDAATRGRRGSTLQAPGTSADAAAFGSRARLRNVCRDLVRNAPLAARGISVIAGSVVGGAGIVPSIEARDDAVHAAVRALVERHLTSRDLDAYGEQTLAGLQETAMRAVATDGEVLVRKRVRRGRHAAGMVLPVQIELLEADHLADTVTAQGANEVIEGVEYGPTGVIEAYHLYRQHPGAVTRRMRLDVERVPARDILHLRRIDRPGQSRGVPWLAPAVLTVGDLRDFQEAEIVKQKVAALLCGVLSRQEKSESGAPIEEMAPGMILEIEAGDEMSWSNPPTRQGYEDFIRVNHRMVAISLGITYEALTGDLTGVNYSSGRMGRLDMDRNVETWQTQLMIGQFCAGLADWLDPFITAATGHAPGSWAWRWTPPRRPLIDPSKEIPAAIREIEAGLTSRQRKIRALGGDPDVILREREEDARAELALEALGAGAGGDGGDGDAPEGDDDGADGEDADGDGASARARRVRVAAA